MGSLLSKPKVPAMPKPPPPPPPPPAVATPASKQTPATVQNARQRAAAAAGTNVDGTGPQGLQEDVKTAGVTLLGGTK